MENNPLDNLPPETRQRVENALQALGGGTPQNVFVSYPNSNMGNMPQDTRQRAEDALQALGNGTFPGMNQVFGNHALKKQAGHGQAWAHWEYEPYEWALFDKVDWEAVRNKSRRTLIMGPILCLVIIGVLTGVVWVVFQSLVLLGLFALAPAIVLLTVLMLMMVSASSTAREAKKRHQARQNQAEPHRVTFSEKGIWEAGTFFALNSILIQLKSVKITANPAVIHFKTLKGNLKGDNQAGRTERISVLIPRGNVAEAEQLRQRYYDEVIKAKTTYNPREPI